MVATTTSATANNVAISATTLPDTTNTATTSMSANANPKWCAPNTPAACSGPITNISIASMTVSAVSSGSVRRSRSRSNSFWFMLRLRLTMDRLRIQQMARRRMNSPVQAPKNYESAINLRPRRRRVSKYRPRDLPRPTSMRPKARCRQVIALSARQSSTEYAASSKQSCPGKRLRLCPATTSRFMSPRI
jgi:hypothetical protein